VHDRRRPLVLVADDDPIVRLLATEALETAAMDVVAASTGGEALALFAQVSPDAVLLDVVMPDVDGFAVCRQLRTLPTGVTTPIVMMTARDDEQSIDRAYECGSTDFVLKPLNPTLLGHRLRYLLRAAQAFRESRESGARLARAQRLARLAQWEIDLRTGAVRWSDVSGQILGASFGASSVATLLEHVHEGDRARVSAAFSRPESHSIDYRLRLADGSERVVHQEAELVDDGELLERRLLGATQDVTALRLAERRIERMAVEDELTGLPNRGAARAALTAVLPRDTAPGEPAAVLIVGVDNLKRVNDTFGRQVRDHLVRGVGQRLAELVRTELSPDALVGRSAEEDFVVILPRAQVADAARRAREVLATLEAPYDTGDLSVRSSASIGIATYPDDGRDAALLLERAEAAMHHAREAGGRERLRFYTPSLQATVERAHRVETVLRAALLSGSGLALHYQPKVDVPSGRVGGLEALLRYTGDGPGISPAELVAVAEEVNLIVPLGEWILRTACRQARAWRDEGLALRVAVNVAAAQFAEPSFVARVTSILGEVGLPAELLELEITEGTMIESGAATTMAALRALGVRIALDDFGTGFSSLSYLTTLPIDSLKIDRSFILGLGTTQRSEAITAAIISLSQGLAIDVVAEGVETELQRGFFEGRGKLAIQGWYYAKAMPSSAVSIWLRERERVDVAREPLRAA